MKTSLILYTDEKAELEGFVAIPNNGKHPAVILCHAWAGRDEFICEKAKEMAKYGFVGFAIDMYGKGVLGRSKEENSLLKKPFLEDRALLQKRVLKAFDLVYSLPYVDTNRIAAVGFGFGGVSALDLARSGVNLKGAICIYGHFDPPPATLIKPIKAKILILHGFDDPISPLEALLNFTKELEANQVDFQVHIYSKTLHAFATPSAHDPQSGLLYNPLSAQRASVATHAFLEELFS